MFQVREAQILANTQITSDLFLMKVAGYYAVKAGQFFMLKIKNADMTLYRPISIFDCDADSVSFLYAVRGKGTNIFAEQRQGSSILLHGPYGNGFPYTEQKLALIGGGIGMAPLYLTARMQPDAKVYIGLRAGLYSDAELDNLKELFKGVDAEFVIGGFVTDAVDFGAYESVYTCGPEIMMAVVSKQHPQVYVSLEKNMGCGVGACLSCSCDVKGQRKKECKDGPVFLGKEVYE